jgi:hypothetical protein
LDQVALDEIVDEFRILEVDDVDGPVDQRRLVVLQVEANCRGML